MLQPQTLQIAVIITDLQIGTSPDSLAPANIVIGFNAVAACAPANVEVVVIP